MLNPFVWKKIQGMNVKGPMYLDLGSNEKPGVALVGLSRTTLFTNIILKDIDKFKFKK